MEPADEPPSLLQRLSRRLFPQGDPRSQLLEAIRDAGAQGVIGADVLSIFEGALRMSDMRVHEVMVPRAQMDVVTLNDPLDKIADFVVETGHSRFPTIRADDKDDVAGILLAKDLLRHYAGQPFDLAQMLRPAVFVPESKPLNQLLREFRVNRNHMAIAVDEYGGVAGLVTIEDVLEQIVGEIEDEYDDEDEDNIRLYRDSRYRVRACTELEDFNEAFGVTLADDEVETIGGYLTRHLGRLPRTGESVQIAGLFIRVVRADTRRIHTLLVERRAAPPVPSPLPPDRPATGAD